LSVWIAIKLVASLYWWRYWTNVFNVS